MLQAHVDQRKKNADRHMGKNDVLPWGVRVRPYVLWRGRMRSRCGTRGAWQDDELLRSTSMAALAGLVGASGTNCRRAEVVRF